VPRIFLSIYLDDGKESYFTKHFFEDLTHLFFLRQKALKIIIDELEPAITSGEGNKVEQRKGKVGRPIKKEVSMIDKTLYEEFMKLTISNRITITKADAIKELATRYGNTFNPINPESTKSSIRRIIRKMDEQNLKIKHLIAKK
jgi:hypothetical protein